MGWAPTVKWPVQQGEYSPDKTVRCELLKIKSSSIE
jgi:hypothetical protein